MARLAHFAPLMLAAHLAFGTALADDKSIDWTGFYLGAHTGKLYGETSNVYTPAIPGFNLPDGKANNWFGGVQVGYRYQLPSKFVLGASLSAPVISEDTSLTTFGNVNTVEMKGSVLLQGSVGYSVGRFLPYVTGGFGWAFVEAREVLANGTASPWVDNTHFLKLIGAGVSYALTDKWSVSVQYSHLDASRETYNCGPAVCGLVGSFAFSGNSVTGAVDYRF